MTDKYADLRAALDCQSAGGSAGYERFLDKATPTIIRALLADYDQAREALDGAATSLNTIATLAGSKDDYMGDMYQVRGYAHSRARVARAALAQEGS